MVRDLDDFLYGSPTQEELIEDLRTFLQLCLDNGVYLNPSKFRVSLDNGDPEASVTFAGIRVKQNGTFEVDPDRLEAIRNFPRPETKREMQRWLGLCNSLGQFAPTQLHATLALQKEICRNTRNSKCVWSPQAIEEFETARRVLSDPSILHTFREDLDIGILCDVAKTTGIGMILFQFDAKRDPDFRTNFNLLGLWSISSKPGWKDLSPLETEITGYWHAQNRLWFHIMGARVIHGFVDHKPFVDTYQNKDLSELSSRMQKLMKDLFELPFKMKYLPNKCNFIRAVDALSRAPTKPHSLLSPDPLDRLYHPENRLPDGFTRGEALMYASNTDG